MTINKLDSYKKWSYHTVLALYFMYNVNYDFLFGIPTSYISLAVMLLYSILYSINNKKFPILLISPVIFSLVLFIISIISFSLNHQLVDTYLVRTSFLYFIICLFGFIIYKSVFKNNRLLLLKSIGYAGFINSIFIISMLIIKPFQIFYLSLINQSSFELMKGDGVLDGAMSLRMIGITGFSAYSTGFVQMLCAICFLLFIFYKNNRNLKLNKNESIVLVLIILSAIISARSSFLGILIFLLIFFKLSNFKQSFKFIMLAITLLIGLIITVVSFVPAEFKDFFINWLTELFVSGTDTGSLQANVNMFIYDFHDFSLIGDSRWFGDNNDYYMNTDVGWYRVLFSVGYLGLCVWILIILSIINWKEILSLKISVESWIILLLVAYVFIMTFKGAILFDSFQSLFILLSIKIALFHKN